MGGLRRARFEHMLTKRQFSLGALFFATLWLAIGLGLLRWAWQCTSADSWQQRLIVMLFCAWLGVAIGMLEKGAAKSPFVGAFAGAMLGLYAQWELFRQIY